MSIQTIESDNRSSTIVDDSMSIMMRDLSDSTITSRTSSSWHSIESDIPSRNNILFVRSQLINLCLKYCSIEPDIRLTTAQEWKLRTCIRHLLSLCNVPIKVTCTKTKQLNTILSENESIQFSHNKINEDQQSSSIERLSTLIIHPRLHQGQKVYHNLEQLGLYLHIFSINDTNNKLIDPKLFEFYSKEIQNSTSISIPLIKPPKILYHIPSNTLILSLRSSTSLLELHFLTRENESIRGYYYKWDENNNESIKFNITVEIDYNLISLFNII